MNGPGDQVDDLDPDELALMAQLREILNTSPYAGQPMRDHVPCLFTMPLDGHRVEWCRIDAGTPHRVHVSRNGVYRWDDDGTLIPTPHIASAAFRELYRADPTGQTPWTPPAAPQGAVGGLLAEHGPRDPFTAFAAHWKSYSALPAFTRRVRRFGLTVGFLFMLGICLGLVAALILVLWVVAAAFAVALSV